ncbi:histidinol-phosphate transaminase [Elizabethkingia argentiflava]|uniref:Histidinol-phosphate aminotransferase n=1 Tax=Elizabethkingia argenteiflava TaxID=2681556 RepID=A0A845PRH2_9FLAO|nr:histidinol-phosphate transaminase [Elizabethkingia argenteiflava]NAW50869.1 histidinol-phosphate transaminase [Elizabethkingia argenteiflava]
MKNFNVKSLVQSHILKLQSYASARAEYSGENGIFLDANENPYGNLNRYPDPYQQAVKEKLSSMTHIPTHQIFIGNGSDEVIDLAFRLFCTPAKDKALIFTPTYGMYEVCAHIQNIKLLSQPLNQNFQIDKNTVLPLLKEQNLKLVFICSPNNPTGNCIEDIDFILENFKGIVFVDEAYIDFSNRESWAKKITQYPQLIVSQTFSKARGLASARIGIAYSSAEIIALFNKIKLPYNISKLNQEAALAALDATEKYQLEIKNILEEKKRLIDKLIKLPIVKRIYPSEANFILVEVTTADKVYKHLIHHKIITRNRNHQLKNCIRISIGKAYENDQLLNTLTKLIAP